MRRSRLRPISEGAWRSRLSSLEDRTCSCFTSTPTPKPSERIALLERVISGYYLLFAAEGLELALPRRRLMSAWFADENDYLAFLALGSMPTHSPRREATTTRRGTPWSLTTHGAPIVQRTTREKLAVKRDELRRYGEMVDHAPARSSGPDQGRRASHCGRSAATRRRR